MGQGRRYSVSPLVRAREESFGLLFYNTLDSRLTFVKSGKLLRISVLPTGEKMLAANPEPASQTKVERLLGHLLKKGLIREA
jgi:putative mycofactocin binding protein MftB